MKVLIFAPFFPPDPTGSSVFAGQQAKELIRQGHEVLVISNRVDRNAPIVSDTDDLEAHFGKHGVRRLQSVRVNLGKITWNYAIPVSLFGFCRRSTRVAIHEFDPDAVIIHSTLFDLSLLGLVWSARNRRKTLIVSHTALWHDNKIVEIAMRTYGRLVLRRLISRCSARVVCVDKWTHDNAVGLFSDEGTTCTIPVSVELGAMRGGNADIVRQRHAVSGGPIVLSLGHVVPLRDRVNLIKALPSISLKYPNVKVLVVGMVKDDRFLRLAEELGVGDKIVLVGPVPHSEIRHYLAAADVEIHDLDGRGLGITSVEAMDAGVPIIAWVVDDNYPQFRLRSYGPTGFIDDGSPESITNVLHRILSDEEFRTDVRNSQRILVDNVYSVRSVTSQYLELLKL